MAKLSQHLFELKAWVVFTVLGSYLILSWVFFSLAGEVTLTDRPMTFLYFAATTASTVGYGDLSPQTDAGRMVATLWFFPAGLLIFSAILGRFAGLIVRGIQKMSDGSGSFEKIQNATVIIGYHREHTSLMIDNLIAGDDDDNDIIVLTGEKNVQIPEGARLVLAERLDALNALRRAAVANALKIIVATESDAQTFNICLAAREINADVHIVASFDDRDTAERAGRFAKIEPIVSNLSERLVRAAQDPGSGGVLTAIASAGVGATIYSVLVECDDKPVSIKDIEHILMESEGTLIAICQPNSREHLFKPFPAMLECGGTFYYLATRRLSAEGITTKLERSDVQITV